MKPQKEEKRINHKDFFESCYLRHKYLQRAKYSPTREELKPYYKIVENFGRNTFYVYKNLFLLVGLDLEDVMNTTQVYLVSYLGLFALERNPEKLLEFKKTFKSHNSIICTKENILDKNKANFTCFLKQRLQDLVRVCRQKAKNIKGIVAEEFLVFSGTKKPPLDVEDLLENHEKHGYKSIDTASFKKIKNRFKNQEGPVYLFNKRWYVCVPIRKKNLTLDDFISNNFDPRDNFCNMDPEEFYDRKRMAIDKLNFTRATPKQKTKVIKTFLEENKNNPELKEELKIASDFLRNIEE